MPPNAQESAPWSFHDAAKALREILKIFDDLVKRGGKAVDAYRWYQRKKAARALDVLRFKEGGFIDVLRRIAAGQFKQSDLDQINAILKRTGPEVKESIYQLERLTDLLREQLGMGAAMALEDIISSGRSKDAVRMGLMELADIRLTTSSKHAEIASKHSEIAHNILMSVLELNDRIISLHELLLTETKKRAAIAKRKTVAKKATKQRTLT